MNLCLPDQPAMSLKENEFNRRPKHRHAQLPWRTPGAPGVLSGRPGGRAPPHATKEALSRTESSEKRTRSPISKMRRCVTPLNSHRGYSGHVAMHMAMVLFDVVGYPRCSTLLKQHSQGASAGCKAEPINNKCTCPCSSRCGVYGRRPVPLVVCHTNHWMSIAREGGMKALVVPRHAPVGFYGPIWVLRSWLSQPRSRIPPYGPRYPAGFPIQAGSAFHVHQDIDNRVRHAQPRG